MRIVRYLNKSKLAVLLVVLLLIIQAFADLALPRYTAQIVDVGIQQSGINNVSPEEMTEETYNTVASFMPSDTDADALAKAYYKTDSGTYHLTDEGEEQREALDAILTDPFAIIFASTQDDSIDLDQIKQQYIAGNLDASDISHLEESASGSMEGDSSNLLEQQALLQTRAEYEALDYDINSLQMSFLVRVGLQMLAITALGMAVAIVIGFIASRTAAKIARDLRNRFFKTVVSFSDAEIQSFSAASLITRGTNDIQQIQIVLVMLLRMVLFAPILAIGGIIMVATTVPEMSWIICLAVGIILVFVFILFKIAMPKFKIMQKLIDRVNLVSREILTGVSVVRVFDRQEYEGERFDEASTTLMRTQLFTTRAMVFMMPLMMLVMNGVSVLIVWVGGSYIDLGMIQTGDMIAFITYSMVIIMSFLMISMIAVFIPRADVAAQRINEVLDTSSSITDPDEAKDESIDVAQGATVSFNDVTFAYPDSKKAVLEDVSFSAEPGKTTAIVGSTGSGKSTVIKLIERFYDVTKGSITLDGVDIRNLSQKTLRKNIGYVPQKAFLFSGTIESNIEYAGDIDNEQALKALEVAQAREFVESKEDGIKSDVSQGGTNVSGGQRQRLSIARALATGARVFLFDDSFSALDYKTDAALRDALATQLDNKTILIVAQRLSTVMGADQIVVLDEGKIVGKGTHRELLANCETYREIAYSQLSPEELGEEVHRG